MKIKIKVDYKLNNLDLENLENGLSFFHLKNVCWEYDELNSYIIVEILEENEIKQIEEKFQIVLDKIKPFDENEKIEILFNNLKVNPICSTDIFSQLLERGEVFQYEPGIFSFSGFFLRIINTLDKKFKEFSKTQNAQEVQLPITTPLSDLQKSEFFKRTPQFAQFISLMPDSAQEISDFSSSIEHGEIKKEMCSLLRPPKHMCRSAVCLSSYPRYKNKIVKSGEDFCLTTMGKNFRNESVNVVSLERLYEFSMREIIYFGSSEFVNSKLEECIGWFKEFLTLHSLKSVIQVANDPFFIDNLQALQYYQRSQKTKYEVRLINPFSHKEISCGSINNHGTHFSKSFNIKHENGDYLTTGCVGLGLERMAFLILCQHGLNQEKWPKSLREYFQL